MMIMSSLPLAALARGSSFAPDPRFVVRRVPAAAALVPDDPLARARAEGYATGCAETQQAADDVAVELAAGRIRIELALARLDAEQTEQLRQKLFAAIEALCEASLAPLRLDPDALAARVERAAAMLARADDERILRLHPADLALLAAQLPDGLPVLADPALERGALRVETSNGGVEDGPEQWRRAIAKALGGC